MVHQGTFLRMGMLLSICSWPFNQHQGSKNVRTILVSMSVVAAVALAAGGKKDVMLPASELKWETPPGGLPMAALWGDRWKGEHGTLMKLPAGMVSPPHTHT